MMRFTVAPHPGLSRTKAMLNRIRSARYRPRTVLLLAVAASLLLHVAATQWDVRFPDQLEDPAPLAVSLTELPPPPAPVPVPVPKKKPKRSVHVAAAPPPVVADRPEEPAGEPIGTASQNAAPEASPAPPALDEPVAATPVQDLPPMPKQLPPRIDLAYRAFLGTHGFFVGDAVYRLEHSANQYKISTVGQARGLAALLFRGEGKATSEGTITASGLQPDLYSVERTNDNRRESATFDWETGMVLLKDDQSLPLQLPTFDPLAVMWQFYFSPPEQDSEEFNIATTRKIYHYVFRRIGTETVTLPFGNIEAQVWRRQTGDGGIEAQIWLAPSLHNVAVKIRVSNDRVTVEALLDSIRVDETIAQQ